MQDGRQTEVAQRETELLPVGVRRDGSFYTRVVWTDKTEKDPTFWVNNLIDDDTGRNGGTWGANSEDTADVVLDFFGETQTVGKICLYKNVGLSISILEELARSVRFYISNEDAGRALRRQEDKIDAVTWEYLGTMDVIMEEGWQTFTPAAPVEARYLRMELVDNFCKRDASFIPWIEMNEIKIYPGVS